MDTKTIALFGGSGRTGQVCVDLLHKTYSLKLLVRSNSQYSNDDPNITIIKGQLTNRSAIDSTLIGCSAVVIAFGPRPPYTDIFCTEATKLIIDSMYLAQIDRLIVVTGAMIGEQEENMSWFMRLMRRQFRKRSQALALDRDHQEQIIKNSQLQWTIVKPPRLTNGRSRLKYKVDTGLKVTAFSSLSRIDLAHFIAKELAEPKYIGSAPIIKY